MNQNMSIRFVKRYIVSSVCYVKNKYIKENKFECKGKLVNKEVKKKKTIMKDKFARKL
jgi:hypothetical protein